MTVERLLRNVLLFPYHLLLVGILMAVWLLLYVVSFLRAAVRINRRPLAFAGGVGQIFQFARILTQ